MNHAERIYKMTHKTEDSYYRTFPAPANGEWGSVEYIRADVARDMIKRPIEYFVEAQFHSCQAGDVADYIIKEQGSV